MGTLDNFLDAVWAGVGINLCYTQLYALAIAMEFATDVFDELDDCSSPGTQGRFSPPLLSTPAGLGEWSKVLLTIQLELYAHPPFRNQKSECFRGLLLCFVAILCSTRREKTCNA